MMREGRWTGRLPRPMQAAAVLAGLLAACWLAYTLRAESQERAGGDRERGSEERRVALHQLELMQMALPALREGGRQEAAELLNRAIQARKVALEGLRGEEAEGVRRRAPTAAQQAEVLALAARLWRQLGNAEKAGAIGQLAEQLARGRDRGRESDRGAREAERGPRDRERRGGDEAQVARRQLEVMRIAMQALREAKKGDAIELLERAILARESALQGRRGDQPRRARPDPPTRAQQAEILALAAGLWREYGNREKAAAVAQLAEQLASRRDRERAPETRDRDREQRRDRERADRPVRDREPTGDRERADRPGPALQRIERLEQRLSRLEQLIETLQRDLRQIKQKLD